MESDAARVLREQVADRATAAQRASGGRPKLLGRLPAALRSRHYSLNKGGHSVRSPGDGL